MPGFMELLIIGFIAFGLCSGMYLLYRAGSRK